MSDELSPYEFLAREFDRLAILRKMWSADEVAAIIRRHAIPDPQTTGHSNLCPAGIAALEARLAEMTRRRDEWRKKAEGFDEVRQALREKVGAPWPPNMSRALWAGIAADEKKRADAAEARLAEALKALEETDRILRDIDRHETTRVVDAQDRISVARRALTGGKEDG